MAVLALRTLAAACVFAALLGFSRFSFGLLLPALMREVHGSYGAYGIIAAANFAGYLAGTAAVPFLLNVRRDARLWNAAAITCMAIAMAATSLSFTLWQLGTLRFLVGFCSGIGAILTITIALEGVPERLRGLTAGGIWAGGAAGLAISGAFIDPHAHFGWRMQYALMGAASLGALAAFVVFRASQAPRVLAAPRGMPFRWNEPLGRLGIAYALFGFGYIVYMVYASSYRLSAGDTASALASSWMTFGFGGAAGALLWGKIFDVYRSPVTLCVALATGALGVIANLPFVTGMAVFGTPALVSALARDIADGSLYAKALAALTLCFGAGQIAGPIGAGFVIDHVGLAAGIPMTAGPMMLAAAASYVRRAR